MVQVGRLRADHAAERHTENAGVLEVQASGQDAGGVGPVHHGQLVEGEDGVQREIRDDATPQRAVPFSVGGSTLGLMLCWSKSLR